MQNDVGISNRTSPGRGLVYALPGSSMNSTGLLQVCVPVNNIDFKVHSFGYFADESPFSYPFPVLMFQIFICMLFTRIMYYILRPLKQPRIISDLIGGMLMSPGLLGEIDLKYTDDKGKRVTLWSLIFPDKQQAVVRTMADVGLMFYLFLISVKMDPKILTRTGRKAWIIGMGSLLVPFTVVLGLFAFLGDKISTKITRTDFMTPVAVSLTATSFAVLSDVLTELNLLNSELGRLAMSCGMVHGLFTFINMGAFVAINQSQGGPQTAAFALLSLGLFVLLIVYAFRPWMLHIVRTTPRGGRIKERQIFSIFACVVVTAVASDYIGASFVFLPIIMGLCVPEGPPLGSALVDKAQLLSGEVLMPLLFLVGGKEVVFRNYSAKAWKLMAVCFGGVLAKLVGTVAPAIYCNIPLENAFMLGFIMNFRGLIEMITFLNYRLGNLLGEEAYSTVILWAAVTTATFSPIVSIFYKPLTNRYNLGRRSVQNVKDNAELRLLACVHNEIPVPSIVNLLELSYPCEEMPLCVYVLHLVELTGRANSTLIAHKNKKGFINPTEMDRLHNVFIEYEQNKKGYVAVQPFTSVAPFKSMHQDICALAAEKNVALIVVPFRRVTSSMENEDLALRSNIPHILAQAPCSVGILIYPDDMAPVTPLPGNFQQQLGVLFWGGPDDREALAYASRMVHRQGVSLTIVHFLQPVDRRDIKQRQLDDDLLSKVRFDNMNNEHVVIDEVVVRDVEQTITVIKSLGNSYNLMIVGRRQGPNSLLDEGLADWSECPELGVVGDMLASKDFESSNAILVMQQRT